MQVVVLCMSLNAYVSLSYRLKQEVLLVAVINAMSFFVLFVSGIGLLGLTLIDVHRQRREMGLRLAVGARRKDIVILILGRVLITILAPGLLGIGLGYLLTPYLAHAMAIPVMLGPVPLLASVAVLLIFGVLVGLYPARLASRLEPISVLKHRGSGL